LISLGKDNKKGKWKYIMKFAAFWAFGLGAFIHILNLLFNGFQSTVSIWLYSVVAIISAAIIIYPFGILAGFLTWKRRQVSRVQ